MRVRGPDDPLHPGTSRILIAGTSGSGKTTLARQLGEQLGIHHIEMDNLHWGQEWTPRTGFADRVRVLAESEAWITEWQYQSARPIITPRAQAMLWLDYSVPLRMYRVTRRTLRRSLTREPMWDVGLRERPPWTVLTDEDHIIRYAWRTRHKFEDLPRTVEETYAHLDLYRFRSPSETARWMAGALTDSCT